MDKLLDLPHYNLFAQPCEDKETNDNTPQSK